MDTVGSAALVTMSLKSGVSLSISVNYISAMPGGEDAEVDARVVKVHAFPVPVQYAVVRTEIASSGICSVLLTVVCVNLGMTHW